VKKYGELDRSQMTVRHMHIACRLPTATDTQSEYVIITALPPWKCLRESASLELQI